MSIKLRLLPALLIVGSAFLSSQCNSSKLSGGVQTTAVTSKAADATAETSTSTSTATESSKSTESTTATPAAESTVATVETPAVAIPTTQEQINDCSACLTRANELTQTIGYTASMSRTINFHYYKVSPVYKLCDIHFMRNLRDDIEDHDGLTTSVLKTQVVLYCPCSCNWAESR